MIPILTRIRCSSGTVAFRSASPRCSETAHSTASTTLPFLAYAQAFLTLDYGRGAATALMALVVVIALALVYARDVRKTEGEA